MRLLLPSIIFAQFWSPAVKNLLYERARNIFFKCLHIVIIYYINKYGWNQGWRSRIFFIFINVTWRDFPHWAETPFLLLSPVVNDPAMIAEPRSSIAAVLQLPEPDFRSAVLRLPDFRPTSSVSCWEGSRLRGLSLPILMKNAIFRKWRG